MLKTFIKGGIHPKENKLTKGVPIEKLPLPKMVIIPLAQHLGAQAAPMVNVGDKVKTGQLIARSSGFISANIHSSVSGTVKKIEPALDSSGYKRNAIVIETEGDVWDDKIERENNLITTCTLTKDEIIKKISGAGIVGLGGATFPSHVKLNLPAGKKATHLVINGVECEPFLTCDHRLMLEKGDELMVGTHILMKALDVNKAIIGIENNKIDAIDYLRKLALKNLGISVMPLKVKYPQGGEKMLIKAVLNREVPSGGIPVDVGAVAFNVGTVFAVYEAVQKNKPLFERIVTVTGKNVKKSANLLVRIGTPITDLLEFCGGIPEKTGKIIYGGPMMGKALNSVDVPVIKGCSGLLIIPEDESVRKKVNPCIRCAKCVSVCPIGLEPYLLMSMSERSLFDDLENENITDCIECGSCSYTCPASRPLLDYIKYGKTVVLKNIRTRKK